ncbi:PEP/pyruvate-binding domain-containing protein [Actinoplanes sp. NEAU-A12]|uniref:PEP/pyruvate-binding domain-containing protein n=1 Tax=Actinoplanes sandaracinus TaxID=3045177 RepID=A0ABT6WWW1_9ACTN|nr:PEP/pyruvate-binding domain-containing protein [Actinoplanes sandaracinus]MDI6104233.1 PEP/pyruvate-binding domain-containing protein [Actinoplanes sandaracinus]
MNVIPLDQATAELAGGKAAALGELIRRGERVPPGFCVTVAAHRGGVLPEAEILDAYRRLGGGPVAVRSSATAEDLPGAAFAGQYASVLDVRGEAELVAAVARCWESLHHPRAVAYRQARDVDDTGIAMGVVVQRMVDATTAGVLFTANPLTGCRTQMLVEAAAGTSVVDGAAEVDRYLLDGDVPGPAWLAGLRAAGARLQQTFGSPQDVEFAVGHDGELWLLQSRPITTLFPPPPDSGDDPRVYVEFGHVQGMLRPVTPMGMATLKKTVAAMLAALGFTAEIVDIGGRLYGDLTDLARHPTARKRLVPLMAVDFGPRAQAAMEHVLADPRFAPRRPEGKRSAPAGSLGTAARALTGITRALARPGKARRRLYAAVDELRAASAAPDDLRTPGERLRFVREDRASEGAGGHTDTITWPIVAGMLAGTLPAHLLKGLAGPDEIHAVLGGVPHNITIEMDLALWRIARDAGEHRSLLLGAPPAELAERYRLGDLPEFGLTDFLQRYGHRGVAEADLGVPRWAENPAPVFAALAGYLRLDDPEQAPDRRFERAAAAGEAALNDLAARARRRPVRGRLAVFLLRRARALAGLREAGKFAGLYHLRAVREQLLLIGAELAGAGLLDEAGDIMFLDLEEVGAAVHQQVDHRALAAARKAAHRAESRRTAVPVALLSDGTDVERLLPPGDGPDGVLTGVGASAGRVTGPARVVRDPATARVEPGDILVTATTDPGWTPLFLTAAALVSETGAIMAHGPTVAREYGIPAVISVPGATTVIGDGQLITVDGAAGTVTLG